MKMPYEAKIIGTGSYVPEKVVESAELEKKFGLAPGEIVRMTGVERRRYAPLDQCSSDLGCEAAKRAIEHARIDPKEIDLIISGSSVKDQAIPTTSSGVQRKLGLSHTATFDVDYTCMSFLLALDVARAYIITGKYKTILIVCAELISKVINWGEGESRFLLGDGAGSVIMTRTDGADPSRVNAAYFMTDSRHNHLIHIKGMGNRHHPNSPDLTPEMNQFYMSGPAVLKLAMKGMKDLIDGTMSYAGFGKKEIDFLIPHQASIYGIEGGRRQVDIGKEKTLLTLPDYGNTAAASIPLTLDTFVKNGSIKKGNKLIFLGTAAGLAWGGITVVY
jgi:3-oxoacyl-[acyl-carrier-protein] synthase III